ncbi:sensor histidine kinase [Chryseolinea lacunae]|uniref:histidine kinase n=1 Tax=Chryseolinea lacunae TaxID=2801331 RepID=A0ABS1L268_9BACT|nr:PAS domain-containing sensor histidine kinase [Chryseolinea lacunae]MBL0745744.1 PAS domain-containing sensor histidine kinase [Chryseolinea lacunae]
MEQKPIALESEAGFRVLFEYATISILVISEAGDIELANTCAETLFGYQPSELLGQPIEVLIPEDLRSRHVHHRTHYFDKPKARPMGVGMELFARKKSGEVFPVAISLGHYELDTEKLAVAFVTDITDQVKAKKLVAEREAWFRNMADNSPVMIWVSDAGKNCTYFNNTWLSFTGRTIGDEMGSGWAAGVHPDDLEKCLFAFSAAFDARLSFVREYRLRRADGQYRWIQDTGKPTYSDAVFTGYIGTSNDIHDQRAMKDELEQLVRTRTNELYQALDREKEMNEMKSRFVSMASHEFRTPLSIVLSSASLIEQYVSSGGDERVGRHLRRIQSSVNNLTNILNDFLSIDKLEQGNVEVEYETFGMEGFLKEVVEDVGAVRKREQQVKIEHLGEREITLDQKKLRYILLNLVSNSLKYSPEGGQVFVKSMALEKRVIVSVRDCGIGIPEEEQKFMFNKFFRAKNTGNIQGTGLGLTIVKRYVDLMGGSVSFTSKPGEGTTFMIDVPTVGML